MLASALHARLEDVSREVTLSCESSRVSTVATRLVNSRQPGSHTQNVVCVGSRGMGGRLGWQDAAKADRAQSCQGEHVASRRGGER